MLRIWKETCIQSVQSPHVLCFASSCFEIRTGFIESWWTDLQLLAQQSHWGWHPEQQTATVLNASVSLCRTERTKRSLCSAPQSKLGSSLWQRHTATWYLHLEGLVLSWDMLRVPYGSRACLPADCQAVNTKLLDEWGVRFGITSCSSDTARYCCQVPCPSKAPQPRAMTLCPSLNLDADGPFSSTAPTPASV